MDQKKFEKRIKSTERDLPLQKEIILGQKESVDHLAEEMKKCVASRRKEELEASNVSVCKTKEKKELETPSMAKPKTVDKSKYKKLERSVFNGVNREFGVCKDKYFFEINDSTVMEKIKVIMVDFAQDEVSLSCQSNNRKMIWAEEDLKQKLCEHFKFLDERSWRVRLIRITQGEREPELQAKLVSHYPGTLEDGMREIKLMNDRKIALKLALSEWGAHGLGRRETQFSKTHQNDRERNGVKGRETHTRQIIIPM